MGWLYCARRKGTKIADFFKMEFNFEKDNRKGEVLECKVVKRNTAYIAFKTTDSLEPQNDKVFAIVCKLEYRKNDYYNFGYKDMTETMGPYKSECPESTLKLLTPTEHEYAVKWRERCWDNIKKRKELNEKRKAIKEFYAS